MLGYVYKTVLCRFLVVLGREVSQVLLSKSLSDDGSRGLHNGGLRQRTDAAAVRPVKAS
jgi:hypothetical protein